MGTSTRWRGPGGRAWSADEERLASLPQEEVQVCGERWRSVLREALREDPDCFELRRAMETSGRRLVDALESLHRDGIDALGEVEGDSSDMGEEVFIAWFAEEVTDSVGLLSDAMVRRAAVRTADELLNRAPELRVALQTGTRGTWTLPDALLCEIYRLFFAQVVEEFFRVVIEAKLHFVFPGLAAIDPAGEIARSISDQVVKILPSPCDRAEESTRRPSLASLGRDLVAEAVELALGISEEG